MRNNGLRPTIRTMSTPMKRLYWVWCQMIQRCHTPTNSGFHRYGGKGITVCSEWRTSFDQFLLDMGLPPEGHTIDRRDSTRGYSPANCRWATLADQNSNRPSWCIPIELNGVPMTMKQAWRTARTAVSYRAFLDRVERGWPLSMALLLPAGDGK